MNAEIPKPNRKFMDDPRAPRPPKSPLEQIIEDAGMDDFLKYEEDVPKTHFGIALQLLKQGKRLARASWNGKGQWIALIVPLEGTKMTVPYIFINTVQGDRVPWLASQTDMLAEDWYQLP